MSDKVRLKDLDSKSREKYETLSPDLKAFVEEYKELRGSVFKITSGKRSPEQKIGKAYNKSHHNTGNALDFSAMNYEDYNFLMNTKEGLSLLNKYQLGILDETDPVTLQKTGGTGAHFHLGKDTKLYEKTRQRLETFDNEVEPILSYKERYEMGEDPKSIVTEKHDHNHSHEDVKLSEDIQPFEVKQYQDVFTRVAEKEIVKDVKAEQSEDRKEIKNEISREEEFLKEYFQPTISRQPANIAQKEVEETVEPISINIDVQTQLPTLPNIFELPQFEEGGVTLIPPPLGIRDYEEYLRRSKAYSDSLSAYKSGHKLPGYWEGKDLKYFNQEYGNNKGIIKREQVSKGQRLEYPIHYDPSGNNISAWDNKFSNVKPYKIGRSILTTPSGKIITDATGKYKAIVEYPIYKKPVQPVVYEPDPEIVAKQEELIKAGFEIGKADGIWGDKSKKAWEEYQIKKQQPTTPIQTTPTEVIQQNDVQIVPTQQEGRFAYKNQTVLDPTTKKWVIKQVPYSQYVEGKGWVTLGTPGLINK